MGRCATQHSRPRFLGRATSNSAGSIGNTQDNPWCSRMLVVLKVTIMLGKAGAQECQRCSVELQCSGRRVLWKASAQEG